MTAFDSRSSYEYREKHRISFLFNPQKNKPHLNSLVHDWNKHSFTLDDFNAHSTKWVYDQSCPLSNLAEGFIDKNQIDFIESSVASPTHPNLTYY
ncbi:hypothetical protein TNIN_83481 [Trichonephila inaurata madagascariensis]|uniref:Endonuclease/exonuclease/phosphatase domain-containing protein n=1 Tax=Trichonephila inaurata madagascariensis TaxID=2747483 RepID=A0A8X6X0L6_9ARAC|nr:hypothetical protein TNIN_83481 [Trichonephila inaurata madagascariensis]